MDNIDRAAEYEEMERLAVLEKTRSSRHIPTGTPYCVDCGENICPARKKANPNACRCAECQHYFEKETRHAHH